MKLINEFSILIIVVVIISLGIIAIKHQSCSVKGQSFERSEFYIFGGCMVEHKGKMIPLENIRGFN